MSAPAGSLLHRAMAELSASLASDGTSMARGLAPLSALAAVAAGPAEELEVRPARTHLAELGEHIAAQLARGTGSLQLFRSEWLEVPWILFTRIDGQPLLSFPALREGLVQATFAGPYDTYLARLAGAYLEFFDRQALEALRFLGELIIELCSITRRSSAMAALWWERHQAFRLFEPDAAPRALALSLLASGAPTPAALLEKAGLQARLGQRGLARAALTAFAGLIRPGSPGALPALAEWQEFSAVGEFAVHAEVAEALLRPWRLASPPPAWQRSLAEWLAGKHGPPSRHSPVWKQVEPELQELLARWSPKQTVWQFFEIVAEFADARGQVPVVDALPARRRFWEAYEQAGWVEEVKVAFGPEAIRTLGRKRLRKIFGDSLAQLRGFGANQCALFLGFKKLVVMIGTHNPRCRFWLAGDAAAPDLAGRQFHRAHLIRQPRADLHLVRDSEETGVVMATDLARSGWRARVHDFIREHSGASLPEAEYR